MRREKQPVCDDPKTTGYTFHFQISSGIGRRACTVEVFAQDFHDAAVLFRTNWPTIELMARNRVASKFSDDGRVRFAMPVSAQ
jgi:hypothetical protein